MNLSRIIQYVYGDKDLHKIDAFNAANKEILAFLKLKGADRKIAKAFDYIVCRKLDGHEIVALDHHDFPTTLEVTKAFQKLKGAYFSEKIDLIYHEKGLLRFPRFSTWVASDLNAGPSDKGHLQPEPSEFDVQDGQIGKVHYNKYGEKRFQSLGEIRMFIRQILSSTVGLLD